MRSEATETPRIAVDKEKLFYVQPTGISLKVQFKMLALTQRPLWLATEVPLGPKSWPTY